MQAFAIAFMLLSVAAWTGRAYRCLHMLQLEGYRVERYLRHSREQLSWRDGVMPAAVLVTLGVGAALLSANTPGMVLGFTAIWAAEVAAYLWKTFTRPSKKPIVFTARLRRQCAATAILTLLAGIAGAAVAARLAGPDLNVLALAGYLIASALFLLMPLIAVAALVVLEPLERWLRSRFIAAARERLAKVSPTVIGVAGSYGKTTTKSALAAALSGTYRVLATPESYNTLLGVTRTINELLTDDIEVLVVEMGARHPGDVAEICELVQPTVGVLTRLGPQHLEYFGSERAVVETKTELLRALPADGTAIIEVDGLELAAEDLGIARTVNVSMRPGSGAAAIVGDIALSGSGTAFTIARADGPAFTGQTKMLGRHAAINCAIAAVTALELGADEASVRSGLAAMAPVPHRLQVVRNDSVVVIDDAFNSNPEGFSAALEVLASFPGRHILITPGMIELGDQNVSAHQRVAEVAAKAADVIVLVGKMWPPEFAQTLLANDFAEQQLHRVDSLAQATDFLAANVRAGDVVLFENDLPDNFE